MDTFRAVWTTLFPVSACFCEIFAHSGVSTFFEPPANPLGPGIWVHCVSGRNLASDSRILSAAKSTLAPDEPETKVDVAYPRNGCQPFWEFPGKRQPFLGSCQPFSSHQPPPLPSLAGFSRPAAARQPATRATEQVPGEVSWERLSHTEQGQAVHAGPGQAGVRYARLSPTLCLAMLRATVGKARLGSRFDLSTVCWAGSKVARVGGVSKGCCQNSRAVRDHRFWELRNYQILRAELVGWQR